MGSTTNSMALNITQAEANLLHPSPAQKTTISATSSLLTRTDPKELEEISGESNLAEVEAPLKSEKYFLSQNPDETERLRLQHELIKDHLGGSLILAPIDFSKKDLSVLDSATADGRSFFPIIFPIMFLASRHESSTSIIVIMVLDLPRSSISIFTVSASLIIGRPLSPLPLAVNSILNPMYLHRNGHQPQLFPTTYFARDHFSRPQHHPALPCCLSEPPI